MSDIAVSVVVPVYRTSDGLRELVARVHLSLGPRTHEVILVDDGSPSESWKVISQLAGGDDQVVGVRLGRNAGQHSALLAGVRAAQYPFTVTIDDDLQNPPEEIPKLLDALCTEVDVVYGTPNVVAQKRWRSASSLLTRSLLASSLGADNAAKMTSFRAFRTSLRDGFNADLGPAVSLDALLSWSTLRFSSVPVEHHDRAEGTSNYSFRTLIRFAFDSATGYSTVPLKVAMYLGLFTAGFGVCVLVWVVGRLALTGNSVPGFPFLASIVTIFSGAQLLALGVIGEYLARMHFRVMRKPTYVIAESTADKDSVEPT